MTIFDRITDGRGKRWKPCEIKKASKASGIDRFLLASPAHRADILCVAFIVGPVFAVLFAIFQITLGLVQHGDTFWEVHLFLMPLTAILSGVMYGLWASYACWRSTAHAREALLEYDLCPHCAHGIGGIPPEPDGCTICPECGAAWRVQTHKAPE